MKYLTASSRRSEVISQARWVPEVKGYLTRVDVITITLSLYSLACGIAIAVNYAWTDHFPKWMV